MPANVHDYLWSMRLLRSPTTATASPCRHLTFDVLQRAALRDALALARATGRTLLLPPLTCWCDRYWNALQRCRMAEAPREMRLPFACPMDHLFDVHLWEEQEVPVRAASFLYHPQANACRPREEEGQCIQLFYFAAAQTTPIAH